MVTIHKLEIPIQDTFWCSMHEGAEILSVQLQRDIPQIWILVDTDKPFVMRTFKVIGTGWEIVNSGELTYIATLQQGDGALIWHLFEEIL